MLHGYLKRHRGDSNPCGQSPMDFWSISLATRTQCPRRPALSAAREQTKHNACFGLASEANIRRLSLAISRHRCTSVGMLEQHRGGSNLWAEQHSHFCKFRDDNRADVQHSYPKGNPQTSPTDRGFPENSFVNQRS